MNHAILAKLDPAGAVRPAEPEWQVPTILIKGEDALRLKSLELQGFKSFPDKTLLTFDQPITAIVGPNGSGKSNLSDAIRWVLGEQSAKSLRGGKMEDVIFGGAQARQRQGFAQVTLTLDQCQALLPDGGEETAVTRRYYRSGESEYLLNGKPVRLRDVNELFMDTGLGQEGYALIGQGKIDEILSAKSTQRREIFEEAAGISHCRHQKEETQRKLERTQENLTRIGDKLEELELQRGPLKAQAEKAQEYLTLREELRVLEISLWMAQLQEQRSKGAQLQADCDTAQRELAACTQEADRLYAQGEELLLQLRDQEAQGERLREAFQSNENDLRSSRQRAELLRDRIRTNGVETQRLRGELAQQTSRQDQLNTDLRQQEQRLGQLQAQEAALKEKLAQAQADWQKTQAQAETLTVAWQEALQQDRETLARCRRREQEAEEAWMTLRMEEHTLSSRAKLLGEMAQHYEGYAKGVKTAMSAAQRGDLQGVLGPVGELFRVGARYTVALETALGGAMQNLLVEDEEAGKAVLRLVKQRDGGRVTCLPLTALRPALLREEGIEREPGFLAVASDLVDCAERVRPAVLSLLGRTVVVDTLEHGVRLAKLRRYRFPVVTLDGEILRPGGSMTGGSVNRKGGILSRSAEEEALTQALAQARAALEQGQAAFAQAKEAAQQAAQRFEARQLAGPPTLEETGATQPGQGETLRALREELAGLQGTIGAFAPLFAQLKGQLATAQADQARQAALLQTYDRQTRDLEDEITQLESRVAALEETRKTLSAQLDQSTRQKLALEKARSDTDRAARAQNDRQLRLQRESAALEQKRLQASMEEKRLIDRLWDTYGMTHQGALELQVPLEDPAQAQRRAAQLSNALRALGNVNLGAVEEFQRVEERYCYLNDQKTDVETAQQELEGVIHGITAEMEAIFRREFARIQEAFSQTFADLFGGGQGNLALEDETDVLNCGIDIKVQPPGKTLRTISLLSGGERSLVAIALYFAILKVHPTPFCVVDEIEAALDEANGARFIRYLRAVAQETQFLLITHRRETMEAADVLYGVTMERQGVSRVLKLDLRQAEELLGTDRK